MVSNDIIGWPLKHKSKVVRDSLLPAPSVDVSSILREAEETYRIVSQAAVADRARTYVSTTEPTSRSVGDLWFNPTTGQLKIYTE